MGRHTWKEAARSKIKDHTQVNSLLLNDPKDFDIATLDNAIEEMDETNKKKSVCWNSGSMNAPDRFPQEIWLKIFSCLKLLDLGKCAQACKWMHGLCLDRSLKYHAFCEIYQGTSTRFIKTLFYYKEFELVYYLMSTAPDYWSIDSCWHKRCHKRKWAQPVANSKEWHTSVTNRHRNEMAAIL